MPHDSARPPGVGAAPTGIVRACVIGFGTGTPLLLLLAAALQDKWPMADLLRDVTAVASEIDKCCGPHVGALSTLGLLVMAAATAFLLLALLMRAGAAGMDRGAGFLLLMAVFSGLFCIDDAFLLHEHILPRRAIPEMVLFVCYALLLAGAMWVGRVLLAHLEPTLLLLAGASFAASVLIDLAIPFTPEVSVVEDGFKMFGIFAWATFALFCAWRLSDAPLPVRGASRA